MSENTLNTQIDGTTIQAAHVNQYKTALIGDVLPRNAAGSNEDEAGSLGSDLFRWLKSIVSKSYATVFSVGSEADAATSPTIEKSGTSLYFKISGVLKAVVSSNGLEGSYLRALSVDTAAIATSAVETAKINNLAVTAAKMEDHSPVVSASSGSFGTSSNSYVTVTNLSVTKTLVSTRVAVIKVQSAGGSLATIPCILSATVSGDAQLVRTNDSKLIAAVALGAFAKGEDYCFFDYSPLDGSNTYIFQIKTGGSGTAYASHLSLGVFQL